MEKTRKATKPVVPPSLRLQRSRSSAPKTHRPSTPDLRPLSHVSPTNLIPRSHSTSKIRTKPKPAADENRYPKAGKPPVTRENFSGIFHRHRISDVATEAAKPKKTRSVVGSPSAWALSPGRTPAMEQPEKHRNGVGGVGSFLKLVQQKKAPSAKEAAAHQLRMLQTRCMQWRFINARAEAAMAVGKSTVEKKIFNVWIENYQLHSSVTEKRIQISKLRAEIKLHQILHSQIPLLGQWERVEKRNLEAVTRTARILRAAASKVPIADDVKADMFSVHETICAAMDSMEGVEATISTFSTQVEKTSSLLMELVRVVKQERESMEELMKILATIASLEEKERSLRVHLIQAQIGRAALSQGFCSLSNREDSIIFYPKQLKSQCNHSHPWKTYLHSTIS